MNLIREITFQLSQCMWSQSTNITDRQAAIPHYAVLWAVKMML